MNREQAKLLAHIVCAYAAGSIIQVKHHALCPTWRNMSHGETVTGNALEIGWDYRIAPKPPKQKFARIALCNLAELTLENCIGFPCNQIQARTPSDGKDWAPVEVIIRKGHCKDFEQHPVFVKWLSNEFPLITQPRA